MGSKFGEKNPDLQINFLNSYTQKKVPPSQICKKFNFQINSLIFKS